MVAAVAVVTVLVVVVMVVLMVVMTAVTIMPMFMVMVMAAGRMGIETQTAGQISCHGFVRVTGYAAENLDIRILQSKPCAGTNAAADQNIHAQAFQKTGQRTVAAAIGLHHPGGYDVAFLRLIKLKSGSMTKVLEHAARFIGNRDFHKTISFCFFLIIPGFLPCVNQTAKA